MASLYGAYGSNCSKAQMRRRCPNARALGKFMLRDARLVFRNYADLEYIPGAKAPLVLWSINKDDEESLDGYEGVSVGAYFKTREITIEFCGKRRPLLLYLKSEKGVYPPSQSYVNTIRKGYRDFEMDESYLDEAIARSFREKNPDDQTIARRLRQRLTSTHRELVKRPASVIPSLFDQPQPKEVQE